MKFSHSIDLPAHAGPGGFDHAAIHQSKHLLYVAHTSNSSVDVIDVEQDSYLYSIEGLGGVAGALVSEKLGHVFTSNRGEDTVGIFRPEARTCETKVNVCVRPNGLSLDEGRGVLLAAGVGEPYRLTLVDVRRGEAVGALDSPGRTRWTVYSATTDRFYVNVADPALILVIRGDDLSRIERTIPIPAAGPHGLDIDAATGRLFCACDAGRLITVDASSGKILGDAELSGVPDVIWFNPASKRLYVTVGDPGVIDIFDTNLLTRNQVVPTEKGAHTTAIDLERNRIYAFLPASCRADVFVDE